MLTDTLRARLEADGFVYLPRILTEPEVSELASICDSLARTGDGVVNLAANLDIADVCPVARRPEVFRPHLAEMTAWRTLLALGRDALGVEASLCNSAFFIKPPKIGGETFWHQDEAFYDAEYDYHELKVWVPLDDVGEDNSPLEYLVGSHKLGVLPHRTIDSDGLCAVLADVESHGRRIERVLMKAGDALIHHGYMAHHAPANRSDRARRSLVVNMHLPPTPRAAPIEMPWKQRTFPI